MRLLLYGLMGCRTGADALALAGQMEQAGLVLVEQHAPRLVLEDYSTAVTLFRLDRIAQARAQSGRISVGKARSWLSSLEQAARVGTFRCAVSGTIVAGTRPV